jgi:E3 ubiquitin-protein ligase BRE1
MKVVSSTVAPFSPPLKMEDRKRSAAQSVDDLAPPTKRQAVNGASKTSADSDMPWKDDLEVSCHTTSPLLSYLQTSLSLYTFLGLKPQIARMYCLRLLQYFTAASSARPAKPSASSHVIPLLFIRCRRRRMLSLLGDFFNTMNFSTISSWPMLISIL